MKLSLRAKAGLTAMRSACNNETGAALVIALMFMAILGLLGTTAVVLTTTDMKIGANYKLSKQADNVAEAGIAEAVYRMELIDEDTLAPPSGSMILYRGLINDNAAISIDPNLLLSNDNDDDNDDIIDEIDELNSNPGQTGGFAPGYDNRTWKAVILLSNSGPTGLGLVGNTTFYTNTIQSSTDWLEYSAPTDDGTALTIEFLKNTGNQYGCGDTSAIVFHNETLTDPFNVDETSCAGDPASGNPVLVFTSTGRQGGSVSKRQLAAMRQPMNVNAEAALMVNINPGLGGGILISGFNYDGSTDPDDEKVGTPAKWLKSTDVGIGYDAQAAIIAAFRINDTDNYGGGNQPYIDDLSICAGGTPCVDFTPSPGCPDLNNPNADDPCDYGPPHYRCAFLDIDTALINCGWCDTDCSILDVNKEDWWELEDGVPYGTKLESSGHTYAIWNIDAGTEPDSNVDIFGGDSAGTKSWMLESAGTFPELWELLQVSEETLDLILEGANSTTMDVSGQLTSPLQGVIYIDNEGGGLLKITAATPLRDEGYGLMYVTGDVSFAADVYFRGLVYVKGDATATGSPLFMGCIAVKGDVDGAFATGDPHILYSYDALTGYLNKGMKFVPIWWNDGSVS